MNYWMGITDEKNLKLITSNLSFGIMKKYVHQFNSISINDKMILYLKGGKIIGSFTILTKEVSKNPFGSDFPLLLKLDTILLPAHYYRLTKQDIDQVSSFTNKKKWGSYLMGRSLFKINKNDFNYLEEILKQREI